METRGGTRLYLELCLRCDDILSEPLSDVHRSEVDRLLAVDTGRAFHRELRYRVGVRATVLGKLLQEAMVSNYSPYPFKHFTFKRRQWSKHFFVIIKGRDFVKLS